MKRIVAVIGVFAVLFALASCKEKELTPEESLAALKASQSANYAEYEKSVAASIKQEENIVNDKKDTLENLGKTEKGKKIVFISDGEYPGMKVGYEVISFDANGKYSSWKQYIYFPDTESFDSAISNISPRAKFQYESSDASLRLVVFKYTNNAYLANETYDTLLKNVQDFGYTLVE